MSGRLDLGRVAVGSGLGGAALAVVEGAGLAAAGLWPAQDLVRTGAALLWLGALAGVLASPLAAVAGRVAAGRRISAAVGLGSLAILGSLVDRFAYAGLYPTAHALIGVCTVVAAASAGALFAHERAGRAGFALAMLGLAAVGAWTVPRLLVEHQRVRTALIGHAGALGRLLSGLPGSTLAAAGSECLFPPAQPVEPHGGAEGASVLLVTVDAFRGDLGGPQLRETMPRTVAALPTAFRFDGAHAAAPRTTYSAYALLTGRHPHNLGFVAATTTVDDRFVPLADDDPIALDPRQWKLRHRYPLGDETPTLAGILGAHGYASAAVVADVGLLPAAGITREFRLVDDSPYRRNDRRDLGGITSGFSTQAAVRWLGEAGRGRFLLWVHYRDPHHPYEPDEQTGADADARARHRAELRRVDEAVAQLLEAVDVQRTIVIVTGDHGEEFRDHGGLYHGTSVYEELVWVPLLLSVPGREGRPVADAVSLTDVTPTLVDLLGLSTPESFDGRSLAPLLAGQSRPEHVVFAYNTSYTADSARQAAVIVGTEKLIADEAQRSVQLYDLAPDPGEREDLVDTRPDSVAALSCLLGGSGAFAGTR